MKRFDDLLFVNKENKIVADTEADSNFLAHLYLNKPEASRKRVPRQHNTNLGL